MRRGDDGEPVRDRRGPLHRRLRPARRRRDGGPRRDLSDEPGVVEHGLFLTEADIVALLGRPTANVERLERALERPSATSARPTRRRSPAGRASSLTSRAKFCAAVRKTAARAPTRSVATVSAGVPSASAASVARAGRARRARHFRAPRRYGRAPLRPSVVTSTSTRAGTPHGRQLAAAGHRHLDQPLAARTGGAASGRARRVAQHRRGDVGAQRHGHRQLEPERLLRRGQRVARRVALGDLAHGQRAAMRAPAPAACPRRSARCDDDRHGRAGARLDLLDRVVHAGAAARPAGDRDEREHDAAPAPPRDDARSRRHRQRERSSGSSATATRPPPGRSTSSAVRRPARAPAPRSRARGRAARSAAAAAGRAAVLDLDPDPASATGGRARRSRRRRARRRSRAGSRTPARGAAGRRRTDARPPGQSKATRPPRRSRRGQPGGAAPLDERLERNRSRPRARAPSAAAAAASSAATCIRQNSVASASARRRAAGWRRSASIPSEIAVSGPRSSCAASATSARAPAQLEEQRSAARHQPAAATTALTPPPSGGSRRRAGSGRTGRDEPASFLRSRQACASSVRVFPIAT